MRPLLLVCLALLPALFSSAQTPANPREALYQRLRMTKPQIGRAEALQKKYIDRAYAKLSSLRKKYGENPTPDQQKQITREMESLRRAIQKRAAGELRALLTPDQRKKLDRLEAAPALKMRP